jgi:hypothetical protein
MIDGEPTEPDVAIRFPFDARVKGDLNGLAEMRGHELVYRKELQKADTAASYLEGFGQSSGDFDIRVENRRAGAGVQQSGDQPISKLYVWSIRTTVFPEAYIAMKVVPGKEFKWRIAYDFYTTK